MKLFIIIVLAATAFANTAVKSARSSSCGGTACYAITAADYPEAGRIQAAAAGIGPPTMTVGWCLYNAVDLSIRVNCSKNGAHNFEKWLTKNGYTIVTK